MVCSYCRHLSRTFYGSDFPERDCLKHGAKLVRNREEFDRALADGCSAYLLNSGCFGFESSGLPAHPVVLEVLVRNNPLASQIPKNEDATQSFIEFERKIDKYNQNFERKPIFKF